MFWVLTPAVRPGHAGHDGSVLDDGTLQGVLGHLYISRYLGEGVVTMDTIKIIKTALSRKPLI